MERGINMKKNMRKAISVLLIAIAAVMLLAGCGTKNQETDIEEQTPPEEVVVDEGEPESESSDTLDKTYLLSDLEYMDAGTGEWTPSDFVPGAEKYVIIELTLSTIRSIKYIKYFFLKINLIFSKNNIDFNIFLDLVKFFHFCTIFKNPLILSFIK